MGSEDSRKRGALAAEYRAAKLRKKTTVSEEKLVLSSNAMDDASHRASLQTASPQEQLHGVTRQKDESVFWLSASQEQEKRHVGALAKLKLEAAQWMEKVDTLLGKLMSLQGRLNEVDAVLDLKEAQIEEFKMQNEVQQEIPDDAQKKLMNSLTPRGG